MTLYFNAKDSIILLLNFLFIHISHKNIALIHKRKIFYIMIYNNELLKWNINITDIKPHLIFFNHILSWHCYFRIHRITYNLQNYYTPINFLKWHSVKWHVKSVSHNGKYSHDVSVGKMEAQSFAYILYFLLFLIVKLFYWHIYGLRNRVNGNKTYSFIL